MIVIDGEHYPPVIEAAVQALIANGDEVVAGVLAGGNEKLPAGGLTRLGDVPLVIEPDPRRALEAALDRYGPDAVADLSDEPVLDYRRRHQLAAVALHRGVPYSGADFDYRPPPRPRLATAPSIAVVATGKRTGKTAIAGFLARELVALGRRPVVVAMGRGGPAEPQLVRGDQIELAAADLVRLADEGNHAASDYIEDASLARVPTVGCRRCGGGLAGGVGFSNVPRGLELAAEVDHDVVILEGSGAALPPAHADVTVLVVPASLEDEYLTGYFGPYRLLLADFVVVTMCEEPFGSPSRISRISAAIHGAFRAEGKGAGSQGEIQVFRTVFRPAPVKPVADRTVYVATTAPPAAGEAIVRHLEEEHGCRVAGITHSLSDRAKLQEELDTNISADTLLCEIKAAGIDVAARVGLERGWDVVFMDNVPVGVEGDDPRELVSAAAELAAARFEDAGR